MAQLMTDLTWGEQLFLAVRRSGRGLKELVAVVNQNFGSLGVRNTYAKLLDLTEPPAHPKDRLRAYLLVSAAGFDPENFGLGADDLPPAFTPQSVRDLLITRSGCIQRAAA